MDANVNVYFAHMQNGEAQQQKREERNRLKSTLDHGLIDTDHTCKRLAEINSNEKRRIAAARTVASSIARFLFCILFVILLISFVMTEFR